MKQNEIMVIRESIARIVSMLTNQSIAVTMRGSRAYVAYHPKTGKITGLNIPYIPDDASDEFIAAIQGFLDHEVGHILYSEFDALKKATAAGPRTANLANIIEDVFVERKMAEGFRGSGHNLDSLRKFFLEKIARVKIEAALAAGDVETARGYATVTAFRAWGGQPSAVDFIKDPKIAALVAPVAVKLGADVMDKIGKCNSSADCLALAIVCREKLEEAKLPPAGAPKTSKDKGEEGEKDESKKKAGKSPEPSEPEDADDEPPEGDAEDEGTVTAEDDDSGKKRDEDEKLEPVDAETSPGDKGGDEPAGEESSSSSAGGDEESETEASGGEAGASTGDDGTTAPPTDGTGSSAPDPLSDMLDKEMDFDKDVGEKLSEAAAKEIKTSDYAVFSCEWDEIVPAKLATSPSSVTKMEANLRDKIGVMQKQLERAMAAKARKAWNPGMRRGRIAPGALFKTSVGDDRVFRQRFETKAKNTAVSLVIDCSGSMKHERIKLAANAAYALSAVMERLKLEYEVIGFTTGYSGEMSALMEADRVSTMKSGGMGVTWGRAEPLYMPIFKSFDGKLDGAARSRIAHLTENIGWLNQNVDGECVQIAARRLVQRTAERHIMIVLSDGAPCAYSAHGLSPHLKKTVKEIVAQGVEVIGIGINTTTVKSYYPKHVVLNDIAELPARVMGELTKLLMEG